MTKITEADRDAAKSSAVKQARKEPRVWLDITRKEVVEAAKKRLNSNEHLAYWQAKELQKVVDSGGEYRPDF